MLCTLSLKKKGPKKKKKDLGEKFSKKNDFFSFFHFLILGIFCFFIFLCTEVVHCNHNGGEKHSHPARLMFSQFSQKIRGEKPTKILCVEKIPILS
jgi:hypothetical protein